MTLQILLVLVLFSHSRERLADLYYGRNKKWDCNTTDENREYVYDEPIPIHLCPLFGWSVYRLQNSKLAEKSVLEPRIDVFLIII